MFFNLIFTGNLTADAEFKVLEIKTLDSKGKEVVQKKGVLSFNVAVNFPTGKKDNNGAPINEVTFFRCSKWTTEEEPRVLPYLKKGQKVLIQSNHLKAEMQQHEGRIFQNLNVSVERIELAGSVKSADGASTDESANFEEVPF